jgi:protein ImuA
MLRSRLQSLAPPAPHGGIPFGDARVDACLPPQGLPLGALHEIAAGGIEAETGALAAAFTACWLARLPDADTRPVLWIASGPADLNPAGLVAYGFDPARLLLARTEGDGGGRGTLAAAEAALRSGGLAAVVAEAGRVGKLAARRLHLACLGQGVTCFLLRRFPYGRSLAHDGDAGEAAPVATRWHLAAAPSRPDWGEPGSPRWQVALRHARGGRPGAWLMELDHADRQAALPLRVVAGLADAAPAPLRRLRAG